MTEGVQESILIVSTMVYPLPLPKGKKSVQFSKAFSAPNTPPATVSSMEQVDMLRNQLLDELTAGTPNNAAVSAAAERYIPQLHRIIHSIDTSDEPVRLTQRMQFSWTSSLSTQSLHDFKTQEVFIFEMAMVLFSKALAQANVAAATVDPVVDRYADAANQLKGAGGIYMALAQDFLPRWKETPENSSGRHPETSEGVAMAMMDLAAAQAQMMYVAKALAGGTTPKGALAKLCVAVGEKFEKTVSNFRARSASHFCKLDADFLLYLTFMPFYYRALAYRLHAIASWEKTEHGLAIGLLQHCVGLLRPRTDVVGVGLPSLSDSKVLSKYQQHVEALRRDTSELLAQWKQENNLIYFSAVPDPLELPPLPSGLSMVTLSKYDYLAKQPPFQFGDKPRSGSGGTGDGAPGIHRSDSDVARELQNKLNMGQDV